MLMPEWLIFTQQAERYFDEQQLDEAANLAKRALRLNAAAAPAHQVLGLVALERDRPYEAIPLLKRALALSPDLVHSHNALGRCHYTLGELDRALAHFNTALFLQPGHAFAHFNRARVWLKQGRFREGWTEYEWRRTCGLGREPDLSCPRWDGSPLKGRSLFLHTEQGIGDILQFIRLLRPLKAMAGRVVVACQKPLHVLLWPLPYVDEWFPVDEPGQLPFDLSCPLMSLPGLLGIEESTIPRDVPYLTADPRRIARWAGPIRALPGFKVGVCWQGGPTLKTEALHSIRLEQLAPLAAISGVSLVSLQKGAGGEQIESNRERVSMHVFDDLDQDAVLVDSAAIMQHLDLVITPDTTIAHLAGALGRPVWVLLPVGSDWRWLAGRTDSPWYPTMRLFQQKTFGDWAGVIEEVAEALRAKVGEDRR